MAMRARSVAQHLIPQRSADQARGDVGQLLERGLKSSAQPLPVVSREAFDLRLGHDFGHVRIHASREAAESVAVARARIEAGEQLDGVLTDDTSIPPVAELGGFAEAIPL